MSARYDHTIDISHDEYLQARNQALSANRSAITFLRDLTRRQPSCYSPAYRVSESLVLHVAQVVPGDAIRREAFNSCCSNIRLLLYDFHTFVWRELSSVKGPLYHYVEALSRRDRDIRQQLSWFNGKTCCGMQVRLGQPPHQSYLYHQLLRLPDDRQPPATERVLSSSTDLTCGVCWDQVAVDEIIQGKLVDECEHEADICRNCIIQSITAQLDYRLWNQITCPLCPAKLSSDVVEKYASAYAATKYQKSMIAYAFKDEPRYRNCLRINCSNGQIHETGDAEPLMTCSICEYKMCYVHSRPWHEGQTCTQYDNSLQKRAEEQASMQLLARLSKPCPGPGCRILIMKDLGCDHMTCTRCKHEFCWQCLAPYGPIKQHGNTGHVNTCRYHSQNLPATALLNPQAFFPNG